MLHSIVRVGESSCSRRQADKYFPFTTNLIVIRRKSVRLKKFPQRFRLISHAIYRLKMTQVDLNFRRYEHS